MIAQTERDQISVTGKHQYAIAPEFSAKMILSMVNVYYDAQTTNIAELKSTYMEKLAKAGIPTEQVVEKPFHYAMLGYDKEGTVYEFKTKSIETLQKFLMVKAIGVQKNDTNLKTTLTDQQMAEYATAAYEDAKEKASMLAKKIDRKIGKATFINDSNRNEIVESLYYGSSADTRDYQISVTFELL